MFPILLHWLLIIIAPISVFILFIRRKPYSIPSFFLMAAMLVFACQAFFNIQLLHEHSDAQRWLHASLIGNVFMAIAIYYYTKTIFRDNSKVYLGYGFWISVAISFGLVGYVCSVPLTHLVFAPDIHEEFVFFLTENGFIVYLLIMAYLVFGLVQLERTFAGLHALQRWEIKVEVLGSGLLLTASALFFSQSLLYRSINLRYSGFLSFVICCALVVICYSRLFRSGKGRLALARGIAHRSFVLLIVGGYLIILGLIGEGLRYFSVANADFIFYGILAAASFGLAILFLSERLRRKIKVILHKNFYQSKYDYRELWEKFVTKVGQGESIKDLEQAILDLFCEPLACKGATLYLKDTESQHFAFSSAFNMTRDWRPFEADDPLVILLQEKDWLLNLRDEVPHLEQSLLKDLVDQHVFLIVPMFLDDELVGFVLLAEQINPEELTYEDYDLLRMLAGQSIATLQALRLSDQLSSAREMAAIGKVSTFVLHDLKNQVSGLSLLLENAREYISDPEFQDDMLETVENTVINMNGLITRLKNLKEKPLLAISKVDLNQVVSDAIATASGNITFEKEALDLFVPGDEEELYKVVLNFLVNALEAGSNLPVQVNSSLDDNCAVILVRDQGCGMSAEFIESKLFKPFETTKKHGFGIGLYQCQQIIEAHNGFINVESVVGEGTTFLLKLPLVE